MEQRRPVRHAAGDVHGEGLSTILVLVVILIFLSIGITFLVIVSVRLLIGILAVSFGLLLFVGLHYLTWGMWEPTTEEPESGADPELQEQSDAQDF